MVCIVAVPQVWPPVMTPGNIPIPPAAGKPTLPMSMPGNMAPSGKLILQRFPVAYCLQFPKIKHLQIYSN